MLTLSKTLIPLLTAGTLAAGALTAVESEAAPKKAESKPAASKKATAAGKSPAARPKPATAGKSNASSPAKASASIDGSAKPPAPAPAPTQHAVAAPSVRAQEAEHKARYDAAIAPVREYAPSAEDAAKLREAIPAAAGGRAQQAKALRDQIGDASARKLVDWYLYRHGYGTASEIRAFLDANPAWPERALLGRRAEEALFLSNASPREIKAFFGDAQPATGVGLAALAAAYAADGDETRAKALAVKAWVERDIPANLHAAFLKRVGGYLTEADHKRRLDQLLADDSRWASERNERAAVIRRVIPLLSEEEKKRAEARLAVFLRAKNSTQLLAKLDASAEADWGLALQRVQSLRRQDKDEEAWKILLAEPESPLGAKPDGWWEEVRTNAYEALKADKPKLAYELVREPGLLSVNAGNDAAFLAGWLALRHLRDAKAAQVHFQALAKTADGPLTRSRAHYWLGRTHEALGEPAEARERYRAAAAYFDTFHGQLARLKLDPGANELKLTPPPPPTSSQTARFNELDAVRAIALVRKLGFDTSVQRAFFVHLRTYFNTDAELAMLAHLSETLGDTQMAVRIGKSAVARGHNLVYYAYPIHALPVYTPLRRPAEPAVILGIARQESEFDQRTLSGAGARGILQVMPVTARHVCRDYKIKCDINRLMRDPAYNTMMGSAYISDRMDEFAGSYVLTLAGYNAGPGRARQWIKEFGDPRDAKVDPIDWIHSIPFEETRNYVQKVLSNIQIYRARLGEEANAVRLSSDLRRMSAAGTKERTRTASEPVAAAGAIAK